MTKKIVLAIIMLALLLTGCASGGQAEPAFTTLPAITPSPVASEPDESPAPVQSPSAEQIPQEQIAPYFGVYGYSLEAPDPVTGLQSRLSGCFLVSDSVGGPSVMELGDLKLGIAEGEAAWRDVLENDAITYTNWDGAEVTLKWSADRNSIAFTMTGTESGQDISGTARRVESPAELPETEEPRLPAYELPDRAKVRPFLGTYCYTVCYEGFEGKTMDRYGYLTIAADSGGLMKLDGNGPFAIHCGGLFWQEAIDTGRTSFYADDNGTYVVELIWSEDRTGLTIVTHDLTAGSVAFLAAAVRAAK